MNIVKMVMATQNAAKLREASQILRDSDIELLSLNDVAKDFDVEEDGTTFEENAMKKAVAVMELTGLPSIADDSGLEVDYLNGEPGVYSARYMGSDTSYEVKNRKIIELLDGVPGEKRTARFTCAIAAAFPDGSRFLTRGEVEGYIGYEPRGDNGFGYDPIFYLPEHERTFAELAPELKNQFSHRGRALGKMRELLCSKTEISR